MTVYRTIKKLRDCDACQGTGKDTTGVCPVCSGTGKLEIFARVSRSAAARAEQAAKQLHPNARAAVKERLQDHEETSQAVRQGSKVIPAPKGNKDYVEEE